MKLGFTGSRFGMTETQRQKFIEFLTIHENKITEFHHGDCIGADAQAHELVRKLLPKVKIVNHPPKIKSKRAFCAVDFSNVPLDYLTRDRKIARAVDHLVAAPHTDTRISHSGTWYTIEYAIIIKTPVTILRSVNGEAQEN